MPTEVAVDEVKFDTIREGRFDGYRVLSVHIGPTEVGLKRAQIMEIALSERCRRLMIHGVEPLEWKHTAALVDMFLGHGFKVIFETGGNVTAPILGSHYIRCIPHAFHKYQVSKSIWPFVSEFIYRVDEDFDFSFLDRHEIGKDDKCVYSITQKGPTEELYKKIQNYIKEHPKWKLNLSMLPLKTGN